MGFQVTPRNREHAQQLGDPVEAIVLMESIPSGVTSAERGHTVLKPGRYWM
jgi:hypothetical protein